MLLAHCLPQQAACPRPPPLAKVDGEDRSQRSENDSHHHEPGPADPRQADGGSWSSDERGARIALGMAGFAGDAEQQGPYDLSNPVSLAMRTSLGAVQTPPGAPPSRPVYGSAPIVHTPRLGRPWARRHAESSLTAIHGSRAGMRA
jgi:hypothetical protein